MKADKLVMGLGVLTIIALAFLIVTQAGVIGVSKAQMEQDIQYGKAYFNTGKGV